MAEDAAKSGDAPGSKTVSKDEMIEIVKTIAYALLIALVLRVLLFQPFTIPSASMEPNLYQGDYIIVSKFSYGYSRHSIPFSPPLFKGRIFGHAPRRGDIIVFKLPRDGRTDYIKRLIGLPGDRIQVKGGVVFINGKEVPRQTLSPATETSPYGFVHQIQRYRETLPGGRSFVVNDFGPDGAADNTAVYTVPEHCYFMMGDNRDNSSDSRFDPGEPSAHSQNCAWDSAVDQYVGGETGVGFVPEENLVGRAQLILLSWNAKASIFKPWTWFLNARPSRFFHILK